jgi:hypothetical protein
MGFHRNLMTRDAKLEQDFDGFQNLAESCHINPTPDHRRVSSRRMMLAGLRAKRSLNLSCAEPTE